jgi:hypothetical protein
MWILWTCSTRELLPVPLCPSFVFLSVIECCLWGCAMGRTQHAPSSLGGRSQGPGSLSA